MLTDGFDERRAVTSSAADGAANDAVSGAASDAPRLRPHAAEAPRDPFIRAENEDDDGYDPYSDRRPAPEPLFERDPWS